MRATILLVSLVVALGTYVARYADRSGRPEAVVANSTRSSVQTITAPQERLAPPQNDSSQNKLPEIIRMSPTSKAVVLQGDRRGQFKVEARVDGRRLEFMVDTGASAVSLRASDAAKLNIHPSERDYTVKIHTANGEGKAALARINMIEIENIVVRDVVTLVHEDKTLNVNLLGMTFLSRIRFTHDRGKLILDQ
jgi:aspartyl protease family protein